MLVLGLCGRRALNAWQIRRESSHIRLPDGGPECGDAPLRVEGEEEVIPAFDHGRQHGLHQGVVGIHEDVVRLKAIELEDEMHHCEARVAK